MQTALSLLILRRAGIGIFISPRTGCSTVNGPCCRRSLSLVDEKGKPQDGFLRAHEVYNLNLSAELVVLSARQTGLGKEIEGEGLIGLTHRLKYAGSARVVFSLWNVNDKAASIAFTLRASGIRIATIIHRPDLI